MEIKENKDKFQLELTKDEVLVLFEWVSEYNDDKNINKKGINDRAEEILMWHLECCFEKVLVEPFLEDYDKFLEKARKKIRETVEE